ncbi:nuclear transport factor 2 family protein [Amycolatopsis sp. NPDC059657]|uniref:nuclear transport factor 2 family protein n=1 Tax=Amycolatopsis sp. NPDC059657 TaxID=3346899 RepID=UPI003670D3B9
METQQKLFERYVYCGMTRDAAALADMFTTDGVLEAPLVPEGHPFPRRLAGRDEIRTGLAEYYARPAGPDRKVNIAESRYTLHVTSDPDVFITEIDTAYDVDGSTVFMSLAQIFRLRDGKIALMRDYFAPEHAD